MGKYLMINLLLKIKRFFASGLKMLNFRFITSVIRIVIGFEYINRCFSLMVRVCLRLKNQTFEKELGAKIDELYLQVISSVDQTKYTINYEDFDLVELKESLLRSGIYNEAETISKIQEYLLETIRLTPIHSFTSTLITFALGIFLGMCITSILEL